MLRTFAVCAAVVATLLLLNVNAVHAHKYVTSRPSGNSFTLHQRFGSIDEVKLGNTDRKKETVRNMIARGEEESSSHSVRSADANQLHAPSGWFRDRNALPSLMSLALTKSASFSHRSSKCKLPGLQGNVIRSFRNHGKVMYEECGFSVVELDYFIDDAVFREENITSAILYTGAVSLHNLATVFSSGFSRSLLRFTLYEISDSKWASLASKLEMLKKYRSGRNVELVKKVMGGSLKDSLATKTFSVNKDKLHVWPAQIARITKTIRSCIRKSAPKTNPGCKLILLTEEQTDASPSSAFYRHSAFSRSCSIPVSPQLLVMSSGRCGGEDLQLSLTESMLKRQKRDVFKGKSTRSISDVHQSTRPMRPETTASTVCQRHTMRVSFDELGWSNWVIAPRTIEAYRCSGDCPYPLAGQLNGSNHAMLMTMMNSVEPATSPMPCCVPVKLKPVSLLYLDASDNVVLRQYDDMVIESCGCR